MGTDPVKVMELTDAASGQPALAIVRATHGFVALTLSLKHDGDVEVGFKPSECEQLLVNLQQAVSAARQQAASQEGAFVIAVSPLS